MKDIMLSISRRLRKINFLEEVENLEHSGPPEIDDILPGIPHESTTPIKIICKFCYILSKIHMIVICYQYMLFLHAGPNVDTRQIVAAFRNVNGSYRN
jgi:hypothetical protein